MRKAFFWITIASGAVAAYLLIKRGVPVGEAASDVMQHPFGSLAHELRHTNA